MSADGRNLQKVNHYCSSSLIWLYGIVARRKPLIWSDEMKIDLNSKSHVWRKPDTVCHLRNTFLTLKHAGGSIVLCGCFSAERTGALVRVEGKLDTAKYRALINEDMFQSAQDLRLGQRFTFQ